jgi:putative membrane protein
MEAKKINKDLILREQLALERTIMANDRTFHSFIRTGLYFSIAGITLNQLLHLRYGILLEAVFWILAALIIIAGTVKYIRQKEKFEQSRKQIGNYQLEWDEDIEP